MTERDAGRIEHRGGGAWFWAPLILILAAGGAIAIAAYIHGPALTPVEAVAAGYGAVAGIVAGLIGATFGIVVGLVGALIGLVAAGGAVALALFIVASPLIAIILFILLLNRPKSSD